MDEQDGLFADPRPVRKPVGPEPDPEALSTWQVAALRKALDAMGLVTMSERQAVIERHAGRPVASLRGLTFAEGLMISKALSAAETKSSGKQGSQWDNRGEDTWIDRM